MNGQVAGRESASRAKAPRLTGQLGRIKSLSLLWRWLGSDRSIQPRAPGADCVDDIASSPRFIETRERLAALCQEFGCDPRSVSLKPHKRVFDYIGQSFTAEGEAWADGRIEIYYDPAMSHARLACCLAHEFQHIKYFAVRDVYCAEARHGPLHRRFEKFTPELLAAQRGVSDYSNEHWNAWRGARPPRLFSMELEDGRSEPINETIAEVAKAQYNWGPDVRINPVWKELKQLIDEEFENILRDRET